MKAKMVAEDEKSFTMHDGSSPFVVPKKGLSKSLEEKIRAMAADVRATPAPDVAGAVAPGVGVQMGEPQITARVPAEVPTVELSRPPPVSPIPIGMSEEERPYIPPGSDIPPPPPDITPAGRPSEDRALEAQYQAQPEPSRDPLMDIITKPRQPEALGLGAEGRALGIRPRGAPSSPSTAAAGALAASGAAQGAAPAPAKPKAQGGPGGATLPGMADIRGGIEVQKGAAITGANAEAEKARQTAEALGAFETQLKQNALDEKTIRETAKARADAAMTRHRAAQDEMRNVDTTVDTGRFWASRSTMGKIAGVIGLALGAFGAAGDGINRAAQMLNQAIDRDLEAQKAEHTLRISKGKSAIEAAQSAYAMEHQIFGDELAASNAAKATLLGLAENNLRKIAAGAAAPAAQAQALALAGQLQAQKGQLENAAANTAFDNNTQRMLAGAQLEAARAKPAPGAAAAATAITEIESRNKTIHDSGRKLLDLIDAYGTSETVTPGIEGQMTQLVTDMAIDAAKLKDPGSVARPGEVELELKGLFQPGMWQRDASAKAKIKAFLDNAEARRATAYSVRGLSAPGAK